jgi:hypothetical protein
MQVFPNNVKEKVPLQQFESVSGKSYHYFKIYARNQLTETSQSFILKKIYQMISLLRNTSTFFVGNNTRRRQTQPFLVLYQAS